MNESTTAWDACIASLPPEKRAAAERAYLEISEGGQDGMFPKLFLLLEAHAAYTNTIPKRIIEAGEKVVAQMCDNSKGLTSEAPISNVDMDRLLAAIAKVDGGESLSSMKLKMDETSVEIKRLNRQISRLRNLRVGVGLALICLMGALFYVGYWWVINRKLIETIQDIRATGIQLGIVQKGKQVLVGVKGPNIQGEIVKGDNGETIGVVATFPIK